jgi:tRNA A-37 threonylcarbamoyl transferase component Bud32
LREHIIETFEEEAGKEGHDHDSDEDLSPSSIVVKLVHNDDIGHNDTDPINNMSSDPETNVFPIDLILAREADSLEANQVDDKAVPEAIEHPLNEHDLAVALRLHAQLVQLRFLHEGGFLVLKVKEGVVHNGK